MRSITTLMFRVGVLLLGVLAASVVFGFAPTDKQLPTIFQEVRSLQINSETLNSKAWQDFRTATGANWQVSVDPNTYIPHRIWGGGIEIEGFSTISDANVSEASESFIRRWSGVLQIDPADFVFERAEKQGRVWYVTFQQYYEGIPVFRSRLHLRIDQSGKVMLLGSDYKQGIDFSTQPSFPSAVAVSLAVDELAGMGVGQVTEEGLVVYSTPGEKEYLYHLGYLIRIETTYVPGWWEYVIDAHDGSIIHRINNLPTVDFEGVISGTVKPLYSDDADAVYPFPEERLYIDGSSIYSNLAGAWTTDMATGSHAFSTELYGTWVNVNNEDYADAEFSTTFSNPIYNFTWTTAEAYIDEMTIYYQVNFIHNFWKNTMGYDGMDYRMTANVKVGDSYDNAYYSGSDGSINFGSGGSYFYNLALHADVIYHEYTHGVTHHIYPGSALPYIGQSGAIDEAFSDYFPCSITDEPYMGERLYRSSRETVMRDCDNTNRYPDDYTDEVHHDAMIVTGALWEIRAEIGAATTDEITHYARFGYPETYEDLLVEVLVADDDDGDLGNGTPNAPVIYGAFFNHGIGPGLALALDHLPIPDSESSSVTHTAIIDVTSTVNVDLSESFLAYSTTGGSSWTEIPLVGTGIPMQYSATILAQPMGTDVLYYIEVKNIGDQITTHPAAGRLAPHMFSISLDTQSPEIVHTELPDQSYIVWPAMIQCDVSDNMGLSDVWVELMVNSVPVAPVTLSETETLNRWMGYIDSDVSVGDIVSYRIMAEDISMAGNTAVLPESGWFSFEVVDYYFEPFEYEYLPYAHVRITEGYGDQWNVVDYMDHTSGSGNCFKCGDPDYDIAYMDLVDAALNSPVFNLGENSTLRFWQMIYTEISGYYTGYAYDAGIVQARPAGGTWEQIYPVGGYPMLYRNVSATGPFAHETPCFGGETAWHEVEFDLSAFTGPTQIRWRFGSDRATAYEGWYVDDITIETEFMDLSDDEELPEDFMISAFPNPFNGSCNVSLTRDIDFLEIVDIEGRTVLKVQVSDLSSYIWQPDGLPTGVYTARLTGRDVDHTIRILYLK